MYNAIQNQQTKKWDMVIHNSAVGDYTVQAVFTMEALAKKLSEDETLFTLPKNERYSALLKNLSNITSSVISDSKISSYEPNLTVKLALTPKLISKLRTWFPSAKLA
jgi:hypothetical protein